MKNLNINGREVGDGNPTFIIAEVGINHNGNVSLAKEMITSAWEAGADAVKIQTFITKDFLHPSHPSYIYDVNAEISHDDELEIWEYARSKNILLFSTPEDFKSLTFIKSQKPLLIKIAAMDFNFRKLIQAAASLEIPIILSSGMSTLEEVLRAERWVRDVGNQNVAMLHCVSCYPTPAETCNLRAIDTIKNATDCPVGFSDHTVGIHIPMAAVALGANIIEKHFTLDRSIDGPDQKSSMEPHELSLLVKSIRDIEISLGNGVKAPCKEEEAPRQFKRRGIYTASELKIGSIIDDGSVEFLAPSKSNSSVENWDQIRGRRLAVNLPKGSPITIDHLEK
jgi:N,N'-diacetyllegionaminate synthase